jgi:hypothetical protein
MFRSLVLVLAAVSLWADPESEVLFSDCTEFVGTGQAPLARAQRFEPATFPIAIQNLSGAGDTATLVVRAAQCKSVKVDNGPAEAGTLTQYGIVVVPPDGTGDINNYTIGYATTSRRLAQRLERLGLPVSIDEDLACGVTPNSPGAAGILFVESSPGDAASFFLHGPVSDPAPGSFFPFVANWWYESKKGRMKMATAIPSIGFGASTVRFYTRLDSNLGFLAGTNQFGPFTGFNIRGIFATARMTVSSR